MTSPKPLPMPKLKLLNAGKPSMLTPSSGPASLPRITPRMPSTLSAVAKQEWRRVVPQLQRTRKIHEGSLSTLVAHCEAWAVYQELIKLWKVGKASSREVKDARQEWRAMARLVLITPADDAALIAAVESAGPEHDPYV